MIREIDFPVNAHIDVDVVSGKVNSVGTITPKADGGRVTVKSPSKRDCSKQQCHQATVLPCEELLSGPRR